MLQLNAVLHGNSYVVSLYDIVRLSLPSNQRPVSVYADR